MRSEARRVVIYMTLISSNIENTLSLPEGAVEVFKKHKDVPEKIVMLPLPRASVVIWGGQKVTALVANIWPHSDFDPPETIVSVFTIDGRFIKRFKSALHIGADTVRE